MWPRCLTAGPPLHAHFAIRRRVRARAGPTDGLTHERTNKHTAEVIADRLTNELRHVRETSKTAALGEFEAYLNAIQVCSGESANAAAARALNFINKAVAEHDTRVDADLVRRMQDIVVLTCGSSLPKPTDKDMLRRSFTLAFGRETEEYELLGAFNECKISDLRKNIR